ncbi:MAG: hypothetical protein KY410_07690, partial [Proteobacteria bacterium]|nr:hypothetical protein [Pseudomonadota bacterium]
MNDLRHALRNLFRTPGAVLADTLLSARRNNFLVSLAGDPVPGAAVGVAFADLSTGELTVRSTPWEQVPDVLGQLEPSELLLPAAWNLFPVP